VARHVWDTNCKRCCCCALLLTFASLIPGVGLAKGGTNMHEGLPRSQAAVPAYESTSPSKDFNGFGRSRSRHPCKRKCRGPANISN